MIDRTRSDFFMYQVCPVCSRELDKHSFTEYNHCKAAYYELDESTPMELETEGLGALR